MVSTTIIDVICSALRGSGLLKKYNSRYKDPVLERLILTLRFLKTFLLCSKKLHGEASLEPFLARIEAKLREEALKVHGLTPLSVLGSFSEFTESLGEEMDGWYITLLECTCKPHSTFLMTNEILEAITSILESLENIVEDLDPLRVQMIFLRSLIHFVTMGGIEARKDLLAHSESIAFKIAYTLFCGVYLGKKYSTRSREEMMSKILPLVQEIKPMDPQVYEIYTESLIGSKLSKQLFDDDGLLALKNFLDALMSNLGEIIGLGTCRIVWMQDLYERLKSLRIIVKQQPITNFDMDIREEIVDVVTDVAISICSLYQPHIDFNFGHLHLLEKFEIVLSKFACKVPQISISNCPKTSSYGFVDCILEKLVDLTSSEAETTSKSHFQTIYGELASLRSTLGEFVGLHDEHEEFQTLWDRLLEVAFKVENVIDYKVVYPFPDSFSISFDSIIEEIGNIKADVLKIEVKAGSSITYNHLPSQTTSTSNEVVGFQDEEKETLDRLMRGSKNLRLIAIVGMPGLGKTTLAKKVFDHSLLSQYFSAKAWCPVSQVLDKKNVLLDLLKQIVPNISSALSEDDLANELRRSLKEKRYLIFLDDIWNRDAWNNLRHSFPDDNKGSRIMFTSRSVDVAPREMLDQEPLTLRPLNAKDSLKLVGSKLFPGQEYDFPSSLHDLGMQIVARCGGLPLAITIIAGVLANVEVEAWERIMVSFNFLSHKENCRHTLEFSYKHLPDYLRPCFLYFGVFPEDQEVPVWRLLRLWIAEGFVRKSETSSPEDVAEGYLNMLIGRSIIMGAKRSRDGVVKTCRIHDLLREFCLEKAKDEQFFHIVKGSDELYSLNEPSHRRLIIDSKPEALRDSKLYCPQARSLLLKGSEQLYQGMSPMLQFFKLLKVLDLEKIDVGCVFPSAIEQLVLLAFLGITGYNFTIPSYLANLSDLETLIIHVREHECSLPYNMWSMQKLRYLYFDGGAVLPIYNLDDSPVLYELENCIGAIIDWCNMEKQLKKFPNTRHLKCLLKGKMNEGEDGDKFVFSESSGKLESLDMSGSNRRFRDFRLRVRFEFASLRNLTKLKLSELYLCWEIFSVIGKQLPSLEVLKLQRLKFKEACSDTDLVVLTPKVLRYEEPRFPVIGKQLPSIEVLKPKEVKFKEETSVKGRKLPSLEVGKLKEMKFQEAFSVTANQLTSLGEDDYTWEMKRDEFSKLRSLHIDNVPIRKWIACEDHEFDCFQKLVLSRLRHLVKLPSCLESIETLETIRVNLCSKTVVQLVRRIEEEQNNWGNSGLKIPWSFHDRFDF